MQTEIRLGLFVMKILLTNDDGVFAEGIRVLADALKTEHTLTVSAPERENSCVSRSMTLFSPLRANRVTIPGLDEVPAYAVSGTPVDCVRLGLGNLFPKPDLVISGINIGPNIGTDVLYSGTVGAAHEAAMLGVQAIAISGGSYHPKHLDTAAIAAKWGIRYLQKNPLPWGTVLNINVPDLPIEEIRGIVPAPSGIISYALTFVEREDPAGKPYYWPPRGRKNELVNGKTDEEMSQGGYITVTPLGYDLTNYELLNRMELPKLQQAD